MSNSKTMIIRKDGVLVDMDRGILPHCTFERYCKHLRIHLNIENEYDKRCIKEEDCAFKKHTLLSCGNDSNT